VLFMVGVLLVAIGLAVLSSRPAHKPPSASVKRVPLSLSCASAGFCMAVDDFGYAIQFSGTSWSKPTPLPVQEMTAVSCPKAGYCVGGDRNGSVLVFSGGSWSKPTKADPASANNLDFFGLNGITTMSCPTVTFCMAADVLGRVLTFDGTRWSVPQQFDTQTWFLGDQAVGEGAVVGVSCPQSTFCAVATVGGRVLTWDGTTWSPPRTLISSAAEASQVKLLLPGVSGISCSSSTLCAAVQPTGAVSIYDGKTWSNPTAIDAASGPQGGHDGLRAVSCPTRTFCAALDDKGRALTYDGSSWSTPRTIDPSLGFSTVSCPTARFCAALNDLGHASLYNGSSWSIPQSIDG
jgi:hypothetical protein